MTATITTPTMIAGRYRVLRELGRGGMGVVYNVEHIHTGEELALKVLIAQEVLIPEAIERFKREARAPARIKSEHVVRVTDADVAPELNGAPFMVMELLRGKDLEAVVRTRRIPPQEVSWILNQLATALDKAHSIGIVHRDLKPENIFLHEREDGSKIVKILDFGISKMREKEGGDMQAAGLTQTGAVMGTPLYMSPEQARGQGSVGPQTDVWALGLVTLRLLTSAVYWHADTLADLLMKIMVDPLDLPSKRFPDLAVNVDAWFLKSCERDLSKRFTSIGEQVRAFNAVISGASLSSVTAGPGLLVPPGGATMMLTPNNTPNPFHQTPQTGPHLAQQQQQQHTTPHQQTGPTNERASQPFPAPVVAANFHSTTNGVVRANATGGDTATTRVSGARAAGVIGGVVALLAVIGIVGVVVVAPRLKHGGVAANPPPSASVSAAVSAMATVDPITSETATGAPTLAVVSASPSASAAAIVATATAAKPHSSATAAKASAAATQSAATKPTGATPTTKPSSKFNPEAP